jgi:hypothetical protein
VVLDNRLFVFFCDRVDTFWADKCRVVLHLKQSWLLVVICALAAELCLCRRRADLSHLDAYFCRISTISLLPSYNHVLPLGKVISLDTQAQVEPAASKFFSGGAASCGWSSTLCRHVPVVENDARLGVAHAWN